MSSFALALVSLCLMAVAFELWKLEREYLGGVVLALGFAVGAGGFVLLRRLRLASEEKARLEVALHDRERRYCSIFDHALEGIFQTTPDGEFVAANPSLARIYGYESPEHLIAGLRDLGQQLQVEDAHRPALFRALQAADVVSNFEFEVVRADGRTMWLRENIRAVRDDAGGVLFLEGTVEDISERWWGEQRRRLQFATARVLAEAATVVEARPKILEAICGILEWDMGAVWDVDRAALLLRCVEIWHTPEVDVAAFGRANARTTYRLGAGLAGEVWETGEPKWIANLAEESPSPNARIAINAGMNSAFGVPIKVGGEVRHVLEFFSPKIALPDPELLQTLGAIGDQLGHLLERKNADEALRKSEMRKAAILRSALDGIISFRADGTIIEFNPAAERVFGYTRAEACGRDLIDLTLPATTREAFRRELANYAAAPAARQRTGRRLELRAMRRDGSEFPADAAISAIAIDGQAMFTAYLRDITERQRLEEELLQSQKMDAVGRLAGGIAHDFNNILTAILGYSDLIMGKIDEREWMYKHLAEIRKAADFAASLTHQLLAFSRRQPLYLRVFNINDTVSSLHKMLQRVIGEDIQIKTRLDAKTGRLKADPGQLEQVLLNLCVNARDAMPGGGAITISTEDVSYFVPDPYAANDLPAGPYVKLRVADNGGGIAPEIIKHIFEPFFTTKEKGQGTGLGLATCYGIVKQSGGHIFVDSTVGEGTAFTIYLPRVEETIEPAKLRSPSGELPGGSETILYVEDEITVRSLTAHVLRRLGYTVLEAGDGKGARDLVEASDGGEIDLLFSDVVLPDAGGKALSEWIRSRSARTRVLLTSGYADENTLRRHGVEGKTPFLQKPFTPLDLAKKVRETMDDLPVS